MSTIAPADPESPHLARWRRCAIGLLGADIVLAWVVMVAAISFVNRLWLALGGYAIEEESMADHLRRLDLLRGVQLAAVAMTIVSVSIWARRLPRRRDGRSPLLPGRGHPLPPAEESAPVPWLRWWWAMIGLAIAADLAVRVLALAGRAPLAPGGPLPLFLAGEILKIAAAALTIALILRITQRRRPRVPRPS